MKNNNFAIIEIGSNNTKTHIYQENNLIYENNTTIEFKKNYENNKKVAQNDLEILYTIIETSLKYTRNVHLYGCSIFRKVSSEELEKTNQNLKKRFNLEIEIVSQKEEARYTAIGCYSNIDCKNDLCIFIGGGGSIELIFVRKGKIIAENYFDFGVVDVTNKFNGLKEDVAPYEFGEIYNYVDKLIGKIDNSAEVLILAGGDHLYWYNNAGFKLEKNTLYNKENQKYLLTRDVSDIYDKESLTKSLDKIRNQSDNPKWFDGSRAMKIITNLISHKIEAKYIIPTKINMEDGIKEVLGKK